MNLPNVFQNKNIIEPNNQQQLFYGNNLTNIVSEKNDIDKQIKKIFASKNYVYKLSVQIKTNNDEISTVIIGKTKNHLITYDNKLIPIKDIEDIKEIS